MISGLALAAASVTMAQAQTAPADTATSTDKSSTQVQEFVVTGSRIPQANLSSIAPVTTVNNAELKLSGTARVEDLINSLPQVVADQGGNLSNGATGTADISLRNLGPSRTLVLIDGRRLVPGDPSFPFADVNFIPGALIDRIEVDLAGASSVYGSDAVAGVVNFIMKRDFEGVRLDVNYGLYQNDSGNSVQQAANVAKGFTPPTGSVYDGNQVDVSAIFGANSPDGKGNVEGYVSYRHIDPVLQGSRDYSNCNANLNGAGNGFTCAGSGTIPGGRFQPYNAAFSTNSGDFTLDTANPGNFRTRVASDTYNFAPSNYYQRPDERYSAGFFAHYDISKALQPYAEFMFQDDHTVAQIAPTPFGTTVAIPCNNPLLSADEVNKICTLNGFGPTDVNPNVVAIKRNVEGGPRQDDLRHTDYRAVVGMKGELGENWRYDVYGQFGDAIFTDVHTNDISIAKSKRALNVVPDPRPGPGMGQPVCQSVLDGTDLACVPWNLFTPGGVTPAAEAYLTTPSITVGETTEQIVSGAITGSLGAYGIKSPFATNGVGVAFGAEYRREKLNFQPDAEGVAGDIAGNGSSTPAVNNKAFDVKELFFEGHIPLVEDAPFAKAINLGVGYRFAHYSSAGDNSTYKITGDWAITDDIRIRGGYNRAVRAPNILELFTPQHEQLDGVSDGCAGAPGSQTLIYSQAQCAFTGVSAAQYGRISANPASQYNGVTGGNPDLKPETSGTYSIGAVLTPHSLVPGLSLSADYFNVKISNVIQGIGADNILDNCATTGAANFCGLITRAPGTGSLYLGKGGFIVDVAQNLGYLKTSGIDFAAGYHFKFSDFGMGDYGGLDLNFLGTYTHAYQVFNGQPGSPVLNCVGDFGKVCQGTGTPQSGPLPSFRSKLRVTWTTPLPGFEFSVNWRYIGPSTVDPIPNTPAGADCADCHIHAYNYFDLAAQYRFRDRYTLRVGVNNVFDRDPPVIGQGELPGTVGSGNTYPQVYDPLGRYLFMGLTADF